MFKEIYDLKLNEIVQVDGHEMNGYAHSVNVRRVPGGWIYTTVIRIGESTNQDITTTSVFVPYSEEFKK